jgi:hypothetical protein
MQVYVRVCALTIFALALEPEILALPLKIFQKLKEILPTGIGIPIRYEGHEQGTL